MSTSPEGEKKGTGSPAGVGTALPSVRSSKVAVPVVGWVNRPRWPPFVVKVTTPEVGPLAEWGPPIMVLPFNTLDNG